MVSSYLFYTKGDIYMGTSRFADVQFEPKNKVDYTMRRSARHTFMDIKKEYVHQLALYGYARQLEITKVIFNKPATIVIWSDGFKTIVKAQKGDKFDPEKGLAMAIAKRMLGNTGSFNNEFKKWIR